MRGLDLEHGARICRKEFYGDWYRDPWGWPELGWSEHNVSALKETNLLAISRTETRLRHEPHFTPIDVPKDSLATRPAVVIDPLSRLLYASALAPNLKKMHEDLPVWCFGWRARGGESFSDNSQEWEDYASSLASTDADADADAWKLEVDITSFFASIDTEDACNLISRAMGKVAAAGVLGHIIGSHDRLIGRSGLPQRSFPSAAIANVLLREVDDVLRQYHASTGQSVFRWMDDITAIGESDRLYELHLMLEARLRQLGLELNSGKSRLMPVADMRGDSDELPVGTIRELVIMEQEYGESVPVEKFDVAVLLDSEAVVLNDPLGQHPTLMRKVLLGLRECQRFERLSEWQGVAHRLPHIAPQLGRYFRDCAVVDPWEAYSIAEWLSADLLPTPWAKLDWVAAQLALGIPRWAADIGAARSVWVDWLENSHDPQKLALAGERLSAIDPSACRDIIRGRTDKVDSPLLLRLFALSLLATGDSQAAKRVLAKDPRNMLLEETLAEANWSALPVSDDFDPGPPGTVT